VNLDQQRSIKSPVVVNHGLTGLIAFIKWLVHKNFYFMVYVTGLCL